MFFYPPKTFAVKFCWGVETRRATMKATTFAQTRTSKGCRVCAQDGLFIWRWPVLKRMTIKEPSHRPTSRAGGIEQERRLLPVYCTCETNRRVCFVTLVQSIILPYSFGAARFIVSLSHLICLFKFLAKI
jgi:hypothetical protein